MHSPLDRPSPILPQMLFPAHFVDIRIVAVALQAGAGEGEGAEDDGEGGTVAEDCGGGTDWNRVKELAACG